MMKTIFPVILVVLLLCGSLSGEEPPRRGLFVTVIQDIPVLSGRDEITKLVSFAKSARIDTLFVQIYRANQAWFPSRIADDSPYETCLKNVGEDPFALLIEEAHAAGIEVHAWLNMLSLSKNTDAPLLKKYGPGILTRNRAEKKALEDYEIDNQYFLEPGDTRVRAELLALVEEILISYPGLDGIQFDYIRYPDTRPAYGYTKMNIDRFREFTGSAVIEEESPAWKHWKMAQVTGCLKELAGKAREVKPGIRVSATGCMPYSRAYYEAFQDWPLWIRTGIVDFVTIMSYSPYPREFERWVLNARDKTIDFKKVNIGICAYKLGRSPWAFEQELAAARKTGPGGYAFFHYGSFEETPALSSILTAGEKTK